MEQDAQHATGALGPLLAGAISEHNAALARVARAEAELEAAQRAVDGTRARLAGLAAGARATGSRALVAVEDVAGDDVEAQAEERGEDR
jgi:hypothetical protein